MRLPLCCDIFFIFLNRITTSPQLRLAKIRNPWGTGEWTGDWSDHSPLWTPELKEELKFTDQDDGTFWMSFEDLCKHFLGLSVCMARHSGRDRWFEERAAFQYTFSKMGRGCINVPFFEITLDAPAEVFVAVHQQDKRTIGAPEYIDIGCTIMRQLDNGSLEYVMSTGNTVERQHQLDVEKLDAGVYVIVPSSTGSKIEQLKEEMQAQGVELTEGDYLRPAALVVHSSTPVQVKLSALLRFTPLDPFSSGNNLTLTPLTS